MAASRLHRACVLAGIRAPFMLFLALDGPFLVLAVGVLTHRAMAFMLVSRAQCGKECCLVKGMSLASRWLFAEMVGIPRSSSDASARHRGSGVDPSRDRAQALPTNHSVGVPS